jgi:hypothetical protein
MYFPEPGGLLPPSGPKTPTMVDAPHGDTDSSMVGLHRPTSMITLGVTGDETCLVLNPPRDRDAAETIWEDVSLGSHVLYG